MLCPRQCVEGIMWAIFFFFFVIFQYFSRGNAAAFSHAEGDQGLESSSLSMVTIWSILSDPEADLTSSSLLLSESVRELD